MVGLRRVLAAVGLLVGVMVVASGPALAATELQTAFDGKTCGPGSTGTIGTAANTGSLINSTWTMDIFAGYRLTITVTGATGTGPGPSGTITADGVQIVNLSTTVTIGSVDGTGTTVSFSSSDLEGGGGAGTVAVTGTCQQTGTTTTGSSPTPQEVASNILGWMTYSFYYAAYLNALYPPPEPPCPSEEERTRQIADLESQKKVVEANIRQVDKAIADVKAKIDSANESAKKFFRKIVNYPGDPVEVAKNLAAQRDAYKADLVPLEKRKNDAKDKLKNIVIQIQQLRAGCFMDPFPEDLGDSEAILFAPAEHSPAQDVPWPMAYAGQNSVNPFPLVASRNHFGQIDGKPVNIWSRFQANFLDGSLGRSGFSGSAAFGIVTSPTPMVDIGVFGLALAGHAEVGAYGAKASTVGGGIGIHGSYRLPRGGKISASATQIWGSSHSDIGGATGDFGSSFTNVTASASKAFRVNRYVVTPSASLGWQRFRDDSFVDSSSTAIPSATKEQLVASAGLAISRTIKVDNDIVRSMMPHVAFTANLAAAQSVSPIPTGGPDLLSTAQTTFGLSGGVDLLMMGGATANFGVSASGFGDSAQSYGITFGFREPLP